jgi:hypothetical protein
MKITGDKYARTVDVTAPFLEKCIHICRETKISMLIRQFAAFQMDALDEVGQGT